MLEVEVLKKVPDLYGGIKAIPAKLQDLLIFIGKFDSEGNRKDLEATRKAAASLDLYSYPKVDDKLKVIIFSHGGGFVSRNLDSFDAFCRKLVLTTNRVVFSIDYCLVSEHKFSAGLNAVEYVTKHIFQHSKKFGVSKKKFTLMDDSARANLTVLATYNLLQKSSVKIANNIILYPSVDLSHIPTKSLENFLGVIYLN